MRALAAIVAAALALPLSAQNFSCRMGTEPACLDYGDTVCSSRGMCVDSNALCFERYQCDYEGFTSKSNVTECADEYEDLLQTHNDLVDDFNENLEIARAMGRRLDDVESCLILASNLAAARLCTP